MSQSSGENFLSDALNESRYIDAIVLGDRHGSYFDIHSQPVLYLVYPGDDVPLGLAGAFGDFV